MKQIRSFGFVAFKRTAAVRNTLARVRQWSLRHGIDALFHPFVKGLLPPGAQTASSEAQFMRRSEALVSLGGDGTFLSVARMCRYSGKPVVGVNLGGLGFLTTITAEALEENLLKIQRGDYITISRAILRAVLMRRNREYRTFHALNDVFINRIDKPKLASISTWFGSEFINDFHSDGLIVATPAGSTAYSLAAGGPILEPSIRAFLLTPICPHSLTERPIILPDNKSLRLVINPKNPSLLLSSDGIDSVKLQPDDEVIVSYAPGEACLIQLAESSFFEALRSKLDWGKNSMRRGRSDHDS